LSDESRTQDPKKSTVRHTRAIQYARTKRPVSTPTDEQVKERLTELVQPATLGQVGYFHSLGLRTRTLNLVVMMAFVLELIWRQISGVCELTRIVQEETVLWASSVKVSQQALSEPAIPNLKLDYGEGREISKRSAMNRNRSSNYQKSGNELKRANLEKRSCVRLTFCATLDKRHL
jgi:hypothetical protein